VPDLACSCGYKADTSEDLRDHLGEAFIPGDDTAPDGRVHAEAARDGGIPDPLVLACTCGFSGGTTALDEHLIRVFTPADGIGPDGSRHLARQPA